MIELYEDAPGKDWLKGMQGGSRRIDQAVMQTVLAMDGKGFRAKQALAIASFRGIAPQPIYTIESFKDPKRK